MTVPKIVLNCLSLLCTLSMLGPGVSASAAQPAAQRGHRDRKPASSFNVAVPAHAYDLILARPESNSITLSILAYEDMEGFVAYGPQAGDYTVQMSMRQFKKGVPVELLIGGLRANNRYYYQFRWRAAGAEQFSNSPEYTFHTAQSAGQYIHIHHDGRFASGRAYQPRCVWSDADQYPRRQARFSH